MNEHRIRKLMILSARKEIDLMKQFNEFSQLCATKNMEIICSHFHNFMLDDGLRHTAYIEYWRWEHSKKGEEL